jgi:hypothetical protein
MTFGEFTSRFSTDEQCREYLIELRWPNGFILTSGNICIK